MASGGDSNYKWESFPAMPTKRVFSAPVEVDGIIYVVGGCDQRGVPLDSFEAYNSSKGKWMRLMNMPTKRAAPAVVAVGRQIIVMGGVSVSQEPLDAVEVYDIDQKKWFADRESLKDRLLGLSCFEREGKAYVVGGMAHDTNPKDYLMCYDPTTNLWQSLPSMPTPRYATFSFLINDNLYVLGGRQGKVPVDAFEVFSFEKQKWRELPKIPSKRVFALYTHTDKKIFSLGGLNQRAKDGFSDVCEVFDIETEEWKIGTTMPTKHGDFAVGVVGDKIITAGGLGNAGKPMTIVEAYDTEADQWSPLEDIPSAHCSCAFIMVNNKLHVVGGLSLNGPSGAMEALSCRSSKK